MNLSHSCSIIIVAYNSCDFIPACLKSVRDACAFLDAQIIVLDNCSEFPITPKIKAYFPEVLWLNSKENLGFGKGCNLAVKKATKPFLFFVNPDTVVSKNAFLSVMDFAASNKNAGAVGCRILNADGSIQWACRRSFPTPISAISKTVGLASIFPKSKLLASYNMTYADPDKITEVDAISGSFFCIRKDLFESLNGFDESFFMYGEDLDLCYRAKVLGYKNYYTPATNILHFKGQSCRTRRFGSYINFYQAMLLYVKKHKNLYCLPYFLMAFGIIFAALIGMFSRLIPRFWKIFLDIGMALVAGVITMHTSENFVLGFALVNVVMLAIGGEYGNAGLDLGGFKPVKTLFIVNALLSIAEFLFLYFYMNKICYSALCHGLLIVILLVAWRRIAFWINYFYRIFAKKRHRSILLGGSEDSLAGWFNRYNVIPGVEILGCVTNYPSKITDENRLHLLGNVSDMESICNRTGCRELLVVSNSSGFCESFDFSKFKNLGLMVFLLIGSANKGEFALVNLKYLN